MHPVVQLIKTEPGMPKFLISFHPCVEKFSCYENELPVKNTFSKDTG
jgi:hypothetical protein